MKKTIKILLVLGTIIVIIKSTEIAGRFFNEDYASKVQVETWNKRIAEFKAQKDIKEKSFFNKSKLSEGFNNCEFRYDTISNDGYVMHLLILEKYFIKERRSYFYSGKGDTINHFLIHQDIGEFIYQLNPKETGMYKWLTNKVIFLILEKEPKMLDYGLTNWIKSLEELEYFMSHVSNPLCNSLSIDRLINLIDTEMGEPNKKAIEVKKRILKSLRVGINSK